MNGGVEGLDAPIECTFRCAGHDITTYNACRIAAGVEKDTTKSQYRVRDALEDRLFRVWTCEIGIFKAGHDCRIVAPESLVAL